MERSSTRRGSCCAATSAAYLYSKLGATPVVFGMPQPGESITGGFLAGTVYTGEEGVKSTVWRVTLPLAASGCPRYGRRVSFDVPAESYGRFMGRYSGPLAEVFADFADVTAPAACARRRVWDGRADRRARTAARCRERVGAGPVGVVRAGVDRAAAGGRGAARVGGVAAVRRRGRSPGRWRSSSCTSCATPCRAGRDGPGDSCGRGGRGERVGPGLRARAARRLLARGPRPGPRRGRRERAGRWARGSAARAVRRRRDGRRAVDAAVECT